MIFLCCFHIYFRNHHQICHLFHYFFDLLSVMAQFPRYSRRSELCSSLTRCSSRFHSCKHDETFPRYSRKKSLWFLYHSDSVIYNATSESSKFFSFILTIHPIYIFRFSILSFYSVFLFSLSCITTIRMRKTKRNTGNSATDM